MPQWVVRAGEARPDSIRKGYTVHDKARNLYGFSVQSAPDVSVDELARAGQFKNATISYATDDELEAAVQPLGYHARVVVSPGYGYHNTLTVIYDANGDMLQTLNSHPAIVDALSNAFHRKPNPHRVLS